MLVLAVDPVPQRTQVVAEVDVTGRLDAREHAGHGCVRLASYPPLVRGRFGSVIAMAIDVATPVYEGPFDLLLQLILAEEVDIYEVSLATHRRRLPGRDRAPAGARPRRRHRVPADRRHARRAEGPPPAARPRRRRPRRRAGLWEERDLLLARLLECKTFKDVATVFGRAGRRRRPQRSPARSAPDERFAGAGARPARGHQPSSACATPPIAGAHAAAGADRRPVPRRPDPRQRRRRRRRAASTSCRASGASRSAG